MSIDTIRRAIGLVAVVLPLGWTPSAVGGQAQAGATAESFGVAVSTSTVNQKSPHAVLPAGDAMATDQNPSVSVADLVTAQDLFAIATGDADATYGSTAESNATSGSVNILNGLITADGVVAMASSATGGTVSSNTEGSGLANLVVNGVPVSDPAPNTNIALPGVGYVVLNEQISTGDGVTSSGITVNMIHVVMQDALTGATTGEIIVGSARSSVGP